MCTALQPDPTCDMSHLLGRRGFLKAAVGVAALGAVAGPAALASAAARDRVPVDRICIQLYTVRDQMTADPEGTLRALGRIGYRRVEHAGFYGMTAAEFRKAADKAGIRVISGHTNVPYPFDEDQWRQICEDARVLGQRSVVEPLPNFALSGLVADAALGGASGGAVRGGTPAVLWSDFAATLNRAGAISKKEFGLQTGYHNHNVEFLPATGDLRGRRGYDILLEETDPALVNFTLDLYWSWNAGQDPVQILRKHPNRIRRFHVKDMAKDGSITDPGVGVIDFARIFRASHRLGINDFTIEQDNAGSNALRTAKIGYRFLSDLRY